MDARRQGRQKRHVVNKPTLPVGGKALESVGTARRLCCLTWHNLRLQLLVLLKITTDGFGGRNIQHPSCAVRQSSNKYACHLRNVVRNLLVLVP